MISTLFKLCEVWILSWWTYLLLATFIVFSYEKHVYHGLIREDASPGTEVDLDTRLRTGQQGGDICSYTVLSSIQNFPFKVIPDHSSGTARIVLGKRFHLNYERRKQYNFEIEAHGCHDNIDSARESVHIDVINVDSALERKQRSYYAEVVEGKSYEKLIHLDVTGSEDDVFGEVCTYRILTPDVPFEVDADGFIRNTEPLDHGKKHRYSLALMTVNCGSHDSERIVVDVEVKASCRPRWIGIPDRVEFSPLEGRKEIAANAELKLCAGSCDVKKVVATATLMTGHIGKGCDRNTYSLHSQRKLCGALDGTVDLLPNPSTSGWTKRLPTDDGQESDQIFAFDGRSTSVEIPRNRVNPYLGDQFTISTWMKHESEMEKEEANHDGRTGKGQSGSKGHILCHSDGEGLNRQHYALHVHSCRLVLLLRQEPNASADTGALRPGEWRWKLPEVCDKKWHHYAVIVNVPTVELYVDGKKFLKSSSNPEFVNESPLHVSKHVHSTKLVVGACWLGGKGRMGHYFRGYLAGLSILKNQTETDDVIQCLNDCREKLEVTGMNDMENGMTVSMNSEMTSLTVFGLTVGSVEKLLRSVMYINSRTFPTPGHRPFTLETHVICSDGQSLPVDSVKTLIMVLEPEKPIIMLNAAKVIETEEHALIRGEKIFYNLTISAFTRTEANEHVHMDSNDPKSSEMIASDDRYLLDLCLIRVNPQLNLDVEHIRYPENLLRQLRMEADISEDGVVIAGADKLVSYVRVLQDVRYVNLRPEDLNSRTFVLTCTELNGRFVSNELKLMMKVNHVDHEQTRAPDSAVIHKIHQMQAEVPHQVKSLKVDKMNLDTQTVTGVVVMCVVCAGFIFVLVVLGIARIRNARRHIHNVSVEEKQEMEWDNSALTITVNPMDQETLYNDCYEQGKRSGGSESEDEGSSARENQVESSEGEPEEEEEEEEVEKARTKELEWDDSTLSF